MKHFSNAMFHWWRGQYSSAKFIRRHLHLNLFAAHSMSEMNDDITHCLRLSDENYAIARKNSI